MIHLSQLPLTIWEQFFVLAIGNSINLFTETAFQPVYSDKWLCKQAFNNVFRFTASFDSTLIRANIFPSDLAAYEKIFCWKQIVQFCVFHNVWGAWGVINFVEHCRNVRKWGKLSREWGTVCWVNQLFEFALSTLDTDKVKIPINDSYSLSTQLIIFRKYAGIPCESKANVKFTEIIIAVN